MYIYIYTYIHMYIYIYIYIMLLRFVVFMCSFCYLYILNKQILIIGSSTSILKLYYM